MDDAPMKQLSMFQEDQIFTEVNLARWSTFVFPPLPRNSKRLRSKRTLRIPAAKFPPGSLPKGAIEALIEIAPIAGERSYSAETRDTYLALEQIWASLGYPSGKWTVSLSRIAKEIGLTDGGKNLTRISGDLEVLHNTLTKFISCFAVVDDDKGKTLLEKHRMRFLEFYNSEEIINADQTVSRGTVTIQFHTTIQQNLKAGGVSPVNFKARHSIKSDTAKAFYDRVDSVLAGLIKDGVVAPKFQRSMLNLLDEWELDAKRHRYKSNRKELAATIVKNIDGIESSMEGITLKATVEDTSDGKDVKIVVTTIGTWKKPVPVIKTINDQSTSDGLLADIIAAIGEIDTPASKTTLTKISRSFHPNLVYRAIGEYKEMLHQHDEVIKSHAAYFVSIMKNVAQQTGVQWMARDPITLAVDLA